MPNSDRNRSWKEIAMDLVAERNRPRFQELTVELDAALAAHELQRRQIRLATQNSHPLQRPDVRIACENIVDSAVALMHSDYASLQMLFPERGPGGELLLLSFRGFNSQAARFWQWVRADSQSTCGIALRETERVVAPEIAACGFMAGSEDQKVYLQTGIHACQTTPLISPSGNVVGMISTHWRTPHQPSDKDFRRFDLLGRQAADLLTYCGREATRAETL